MAIAQTRDQVRRLEQIFLNLRAILEEAGSGLDRLVKTTVFLQNLDDFTEMNEVYARHVGDRPPARLKSNPGRSANPMSRTKPLGTVPGTAPRSCPGIML